MARTVTHTITLEVAPLGNKYAINMWIGTEALQVQYEHNHAAACKLARSLREQLAQILDAEVVVVEKEPKPLAPGAHPELFPI